MLQYILKLKMEVRASDDKQEVVPTLFDGNYSIKAASWDEAMKKIERIVDFIRSEND